MAAAASCLLLAAGTAKYRAAVLRAAPASTIDRSLSGTALRPCTPESRSKPIRKRIIYFLSFPYICLSTLRSQRRRWLSSLRSDLTYQPRPVLCTYCRMLNARLTTIDVMSLEFSLLPFGCYHTGLFKWHVFSLSGPLLLDLSAIRCAYNRLASSLTDWPMHPFPRVRGRQIV